MKRLVFLAIVSMCGCIGPVGKPDQKAKPAPVNPPIIPPIVKPINPIEPNEFSSTVSVTMPKSLLELIRRYAGSDNTITFSKAMTITQGDDRVEIPAGANFSYALAEDKGEIVFNPPYPKGELIEWGVKIHPNIRRFVLFSDDTGIVTGEWRGITKDKKFRFDDQVKFTEQPAGTINPPVPVEVEPPSPGTKHIEEIIRPKVFEPSAPTRLPEVWAILGTDQASQLIRREIDDAMSLPFLPIIKTEVPAFLRGYVRSLPAFYFPTDGDLIENSRVFITLHDQKTLAQVIEQWRKERDPTRKKKVAVAKAFDESVFMRNAPWFEVDRFGRKHNTSTGHLLNDHHVPQWLVDKYRNNPQILNKIHGAAHDQGNGVFHRRM